MDELKSKQPTDMETYKSFIVFFVNPKHAPDGSDKLLKVDATQRKT